jgi:hypothetical protein
MEIMLREILEGSDGFVKVRSDYNDAQKSILKIFKGFKELEDVADRKEWNQLRQYIGDAGDNLAKAMDYARELGVKYNPGNAK